MFPKWINRIAVYSYQSEAGIDVSAVKENIQKLSHTPIKPAEVKSEGFSSILGFIQPDVYFHSYERYLFCSLTFEKKKINQLKLSRKVTEAVREVAQQQGISEFEVDKDHRADLKRDIKAKMIKETVPEEEFLNVIFDTEQQRVYVSDSSKDKIEKFMDLFSKMVMGFVCYPLFEESIDTILTRWVYKGAEERPDEITLKDSAILQAEDMSKASLTRQNLDSEELTTLINNNKKVQDLGVEFRSRLVFRLNARAEINDLKPTDILEDILNELASDVPANDVLGMFVEHWVCEINEVVQAYNWLLDHINE